MLDSIFPPPLLWIQLNAPGNSATHNHERIWKEKRKWTGEGPRDLKNGALWVFLSSFVYLGRGTWEGLNLNQSTGSKLTRDEKRKTKQNKQNLLSLAKGLEKWRPRTAQTRYGDRSISGGGWAGEGTLSSRAPGVISHALAGLGDRGLGRVADSARPGGSWPITQWVAG